MNRYRLINLLLLILVILLSSSAVRSWIKISQREEIIRDTKEKLQQVKDNKEQLERQLAQVESRQYIEKEARNKLNMGKNGEIIIIMPSVSPASDPTPTPWDASPNWQKWARLFL